MTNENCLNLFNNLLNEENEENNLNIEDENICLIDGTKLENNFITLDCGHKFNYISLHNEILYQKTKKILDNSRLRLNELKCPYCRTISNKLLPYFKYYDVENVRGVNCCNDYSIKLNVCEYIDKNNKKCNNNACITDFGILCNKHCKYTKNEELIMNNIDDEFYKIYKKKNLKELKEELKKFNLKVSGNKDELIKRLYVKTIQIIQTINNKNNK